MRWLCPDASLARLRRAPPLEAGRTDPALDLCPKCLAPAEREADLGDDEEGPDEQADEIVHERGLSSLERVPHELQDPSADEEPRGAEQPPEGGEGGDARADPEAHAQKRGHRDPIAAVDREVEGRGSQGRCGRKAERRSVNGEPGDPGNRRASQQRLDSEDDRRNPDEMRRDVAPVAMVRGVLRERVDEGRHGAPSEREYGGVPREVLSAG
jgi:hypothetical protein